MSVESISGAGPLAPATCERFRASGPEGDLSCGICKGGWPEPEDLSQQILCYLALGHTDEQIARRLSVSVRTVRRRIAEVMAELDVVSRFAAGAKATAQGRICRQALDEGDRSRMVAG
ncbi:response regulator transcription factor [Saccharopolyspora sp. CA-218241]|uniref:response regulator transcription factor n=1 Tax=Saccharopolyspora sp. CA-218241 TaxID=3240027 RepID=UPI003D986B3F